MVQTTSTPRLRDRLLAGAARLTTPLLPDDYLGLLDPLWSTTDLRARVVEVRPEAAGATTLVLRPGAGWTGHLAGQWVRLGVEVDGVVQSRSYSLTSPPRPDGLLSVTVVPVAGGVVSTVLAREVRPGDLLRLDRAAGEFVLPSPLPERLLLISAGSGITPVVGLLRDLAARGPLADVVLVHSARTREDVVLGEELRSLAANHPGCRLVERHTRADGRLTPEQLDALVPDRAERAAYACGPAELLDALEAHWARSGGVLRTERFAARLAPGAGDGGTVTFARTGRTAAVAGGPVLSAGEDAGVLLPSGCRMGICFGCVVPLRSGVLRDLRTGEAAGEPGDLVQTCITTPCGDVVLDA